MHIPLLIPRDRLRLNAALDWFHTGHSDHAGFDWVAVRARRDHPMRAALADGALKAWLLTEDGPQVAIPRDLWVGRFLWSEAYSSALVTARIRGQVVTGYLIVDADAFMALVGTGDSPATTQPASTPPAYVPPHLAYMLDLLERFNLTPGYKYNKEIMKLIIEDDSVFREYGITMSGSKAGMIATFLGDPKFEDGGNTAAIAKDRDPDPRKPYNGDTYPKPRRRS